MIHVDPSLYFDVYVCVLDLDGCRGERRSCTSHLHMICDLEITSPGLHHQILLLLVSCYGPIMRTQFKTPKMSAVSNKYN